MDANEFSRWARFAAKGGIGKCTAVQDCIAESPDDLMFIKNDEIVVLMQIQDREGMYLGFCEDVVGHFYGSHVKFHSKLKKPVMTKRSSMGSRQSSTSTPQSSSSPMPMADSPVPQISVSHVLAPARQLSADEDLTFPPSMSYSSSSTLSDVGLSTPPLPLQVAPQPAKRDIHSPSSFHSNEVTPSATNGRRASLAGSSPRVTSPLAMATETSPLRSSFSSPQVTSPLQSSFSPQTSPQDTSFTSSPEQSPASSSFRAPSPERRPRQENSPPTSPPREFSPSQRCDSPESVYSNDDGQIGNRASIAMSDGEVGIGLSLLQDMVGGDEDDWSSVGSRYSRQSLVHTPERMETQDTTEHGTPQASASQTFPPTQTSPQSSSGASQRKGSMDSRLTKQSTDWEDIYDNYRYSRQSRFSLASKMSQSSSSKQITVVPPVPEPQPADLVRSPSADSDASVYTQDSSEGPAKGKGLPASVLTVDAKLRPHPLDLQPQPSPLLHTSWGSPTSSSHYSTNSMISTNTNSPTYGGAATTLRQQVEIDRSTPSPHPSDSVLVEESSTPQGIVVDDDEELPSHIDDSYVDEPSSDMSLVQSTLVRSIERQMSQGSSESLTPPASPSHSAPPPAHFPPLAQAVPRPPREQRGPPPGPNERTSLFLPHPNAPKPSASSAGPMYMRGPAQPPPMPTGVNPAAHAINTLLRVMGPNLRPGQGPTIYGRVDVDLSTATGPVPMTFSLEPPPARTPPRSQVPSPLTLVAPDSPRARAASAEKPPTSPIPRANFFPKAGTARPRSRSFSGFNSTSPASDPLPLPGNSSQDKVSTLGIPTPSANSATNLVSPSSTPVLGKSASSSKLRVAHAPSPLSLPHNNIRGAHGHDPTVRKAPSQSTLNTSPTPVRTLNARPVINLNTQESLIAPPRVLHKQQSLQAVNLRSPDAFSPSRPSEGDNVSVLSSRSQAVSPPPSLARQTSLRNKLSLPNLRKPQSRHNSISSILSPVAAGEGETMQVADMDFQLIRPTIPQVSGRASEDSLINGRASIDSRSLNVFTRTASPAVSMSSGSLSPIVVDGVPSWKTPAKMDETSVEMHRQRELKWMSLISTVPASQARKNKKVRKLVSEGVPSSVRYLVWSHLVDGKARNVPGIYAQLSQRARVAAFGDMERDMKRCFADHPQLLSTQGPLISVLQAYLTMVPDTQYTPGLTLIAGHLLLLAPEEDAFWTFVSVMDAFLRPYFSSVTTQMEVDSALFAKALENNDQEVAKKLLTTMSIPPNKLCYPWFTTLFIGTLPTEYVNRVWDLFLCEGNPFLMRVGLAIVQCCRRHLLSCPNEDAVLNCIQHPSPTWLPPTPDAFISLAFSVKLKDDDVRKQRVKMEAQVKRQAQVPRSTGGAISLPR